MGKGNDIYSRLIYLLNIKSGRIRIGCDRVFMCDVLLCISFDHGKEDYSEYDKEDEEVLFLGELFLQENSGQYK